MNLLRLRLRRNGIGSGQIRFHFCPRIQDHFLAAVITKSFGPIVGRRQTSPCPCFLLLHTHSAIVGLPSRRVYYDVATPLTTAKNLAFSDRNINSESSWGQSVLCPLNQFSLHIADAHTDRKVPCRF